MSLSIPHFFRHAVDNDLYVNSVAMKLFNSFIFAGELKNDSLHRI